MSKLNAFLGHSFYLGFLKNGFHCHLVFEPVGSHIACNCVAFSNLYAVTEDIAKKIHQKLGEMLSRCSSSRTYHFPHAAENCSFLNSPTGGQFPVKWLQRVDFDLDFTMVETSNNWFQNHTCKMLVNRHGQNLPSSRISLKDLFTWLDFGSIMPLFINAVEYLYKIAWSFAIDYEETSQKSIVLLRDELLHREDLALFNSNGNAQRNTSFFGLGFTEKTFINFQTKNEPNCLKEYFEGSEDIGRTVGLNGNLLR